MEYVIRKAKELLKDLVIDLSVETRALRPEEVEMIQHHLNAFGDKIRELIESSLKEHYRHGYRDAKCDASENRHLSSAQAWQEHLYGREVDD